MENKIISAPGGQIEYEVSGSGTPVMLVHGFGEDNTIWSDAPHFLPFCRLIIPNLPGTGGSTLPDGTPSLENLAKPLKFILEEEGHSSVIMVGHSMGGYTMLAFAELFPDMVSDMVLFHSSAFADNAEKKEARRKSIDFIKQNGSEAFMKTSTPGLFYDEEKSKEDIQDLLQRAKNFNGEMLIYYYEAMISRKDRTDILEKFPGKILFIIGQHDKAVPFESSMKQVVIPQEPEVKILRQTGHMGMLEEKDKSWEHLSAFISEASVK